MAKIWIWRFGLPLEPGAIPGAVLPFSEIATRATAAGVGRTKVKRTLEPGVILWEIGGKRGQRWFADLTTEKLVFEKPKGGIAKQIQAALEPAARLLPADLDRFVCDRLHESGALNLLDSMWLASEAEPAGLFDAMGRAPGASVAAIPVCGPDGPVGVLALAASRIGADATALTRGLERLKPEALRRRSTEAMRLAEEVERLADIIGTNLTGLGAAVLEADAKIRARLGPRRRPLRFNFIGGGESQPGPGRADELDQLTPVYQEPLGQGPQFRPESGPILHQGGTQSPGGPPPLAVKGVDIAPPPEGAIIERGPRIQTMPTERAMRRAAEAAGYDTKTLSRAALQRMFGGE